LIARDVKSVLANLNDHLTPVASLERVKQRADGVWTHLHLFSFLSSPAENVAL
jgi:hypothetical protein